MNWISPVPLENIFIPHLKWIKEYMDEVEDGTVRQKLLPKQKGLLGFAFFF